MLADFIRYLEAERRYSPLTVRNYRHDIELFLAWLGISDTDSDLRRVTTEDIREWIIFRTEEGRLSAASINREISSLRSLFRWLLRTGVVSRDVAAPVASLKTSRRLPAFVPESRMSDIVSDCEQERIVPILEFVREKILHYIGLIERHNICISPEKALFLTHKGKRISRTEVYRTVRDELEKAGVQGKKSPHVLRHTFATHLLNGGADMREIQELLGHASLQATQVYTHNSIAKLREIYTKAHPREKGGE